MELTHLDQIKEILETGELRRIEFEKTEDIEIINLFQGIYGVAYAWYAAGCRTLDDIRNKKAGIKVSEVQEIGLQHYDDINTRMPREEAHEIFVAIKETALSLDPKLFIEIMGSYRRGKSTCGDIDILITRSTEDGKTHEGILPTLLNMLQTMGIIHEHLSLPDLSVDPLEAVYRGLCVRPLREGEGPESKRLRRRIDFLTVPWINRGAALIYYTGDDIFNRSLRLKANKMGYSLNQKGLSAGVVRSPTRYTVKLCDGHMIASETEEEIFRILGVYSAAFHQVSADYECSRPSKVCLGKNLTNGYGPSKWSMLCLPVYPHGLLALGLRKLGAPATPQGRVKAIQAPSLNIVYTLPTLYKR
ncbi:hypothetical protein EWM64_g3625 [Hericium alpestre]|uniref:DNA polymerase n=1 Tax=Hericium alpestre TaxID=135208 RepID=A0A4Z0A256_9AGAM|nr:hypothetical protein EWM64_g3625 [Hericium alpestre]